MTNIYYIVYNINIIPTYNITCYVLYSIYIIWNICNIYFNILRYVLYKFKIYVIFYIMAMVFEICKYQSLHNLALFPFELGQWIMIWTKMKNWNVIAIGINFCFSLLYWGDWDKFHAKYFEGCGMRLVIFKVYFLSLSLVRFNLSGIRDNVLWMPSWIFLVNETDTA